MQYPESHWKGIHNRQLLFVIKYWVKSNEESQVQWCMPVTSATQEAEAEG
jgi:hypothetical protein